MQKILLDRKGTLRVGIPIKSAVDFLPMERFVSSFQEAPTVICSSGWWQILKGLLSSVSWFPEDTNKENTPQDDRTLCVFYLCCSSAQLQAGLSQ